MFPVGDITQLIGKNLCVANLGIDVSVRMSVNPIVGAGVGNVATQLHSESSIDKAVTKLWCSCCSKFLNMSFFLNNNVEKIHQINKPHNFFFTDLSTFVCLLRKRTNVKTI